MPARILVEVELDFHDKTLAQIEAELMDRLRAALVKGGKMPSGVHIPSLDWLRNAGR